MNMGEILLSDKGLESRFWNLVDKRQDHECWEWKGTHGGNYGQIKTKRFGVAKKRYSLTASRYSLFLKTGEWPEYRVYACHTCDNTNCCNPNHLFWGDGEANQLDAMAKQRRKSPFKTLKQASEVKKGIIDRRAEGCSYQRISDDLGISVVAAWRIANGVRWKNA